MSGEKEIPELFHWNSTYSVGINTFDSQHRGLVGLINEFHMAMVSGRSKEIMEYVLERLVKYSQEHFATEEHVLAAHAYYGLEVQRYQHRKFVEAIERFQRDYREGKVVPTVDGMFFLKDWLKNHLIGTDQKYMPFLKEKGLS